MSISTANNKGDPHITTLDGYTYTFNGKGEYILLQVYTEAQPVSKVCEIQGRTTGAPVPVDKTSHATVFTAFAHECADNMVSI